MGGQRATGAAKRGSACRPSKAGSTLSKTSESPAPRAPSEAIRTLQPYRRYSLTRADRIAHLLKASPVARGCMAIASRSTVPRPRTASVLSPLWESLLVAISICSRCLDETWRWARDETEKGWRDCSWLRTGARSRIGMAPYSYLELETLVTAKQLDKAVKQMQRTADAEKP